MSWGEIHRTIESLRAHPQAHFLGPQPNDLLDSAEERLGIRFPDAYRVFLQQLGAGSVGPEEIYGVFQRDFDHSSVPDAVWMTLDARRNLELPGSGIVVGFDGAETFVVLDMGRRLEDGTVPVVEWAPGQPLEASPILAADFSAYLAQVLDQVS